MTKLVKIPESVSLAIHSMAILAGQADEVKTTREIADSLGASSAHLAKVLKTLEHMGYVSSQRGPSGGFRIAVDPDGITLMEIYQAMEGPLQTGGCLLATPICGGDRCVFGETIHALETQFRQNLERTRLSELAETMGVTSA